MNNSQTGLYKFTIGILVLILVPIGVFSFLASRSSGPLHVVLELKAVPGGQGHAEISNESLERLKTIINENMILNDQEKTLEIFSKEKSDYVDLITIISVLLTVFSLFSILSSFIDKGEFQKLSQEMQGKIAEYEKELKAIHMNSLLSYLRKNREAFATGATNKLEDGTTVGDNSTFLRFYSAMNSEVLAFATRKKLENIADNPDFCVEYINQARAATAYGISMTFIPLASLDVNTNEVMRISVSSISNYLGRKDFEKFKQVVKPYHQIEWGSY